MMFHTIVPLKKTFRNHLADAAFARMESVKKKTNFVVYSDEQLKAKQDAGKNKNTTRQKNMQTEPSENSCLVVVKQILNTGLMKSLNQIAIYLNFGLELEKTQIMEHYYEMDSDDPDRTTLMYSANTMRSFCHAMNQILKLKGHWYDILYKQFSFLQEITASLLRQSEGIKVPRKG